MKFLKKYSLSQCESQTKENRKTLEVRSENAKVLFWNECFKVCLFNAWVQLPSTLKTAPKSGGLLANVRPDLKPTHTANKWAEHSLEPPNFLPPWSPKEPNDRLNSRGARQDMAHAPELATGLRLPGGTAPD
ncbi:hypothetical protein HispidOSU_026884 [Sigmodon hispidus]